MLSAAIESMKLAQESADRAQNQLFDVSSQAEDRLSALLAENSLLTEGSERASSRIAELQGEMDAMRAGMRSGASAGDSRGAAGSADADHQALARVVADLRQELRQREDALRTEKQRAEVVSRDLAQQLSKEREVLAKTKLELAERPSRDELTATRRQLRMLQRIVFKVEDEDDEVSRSG